MVFFDRIGILVSFIALILAFALFYSLSGLIMDSLVAAILTGGLIWMGYTVIRWLIIATRE